MAVEGMESGMAQLSVRNTFIHVDDADNMNMRHRLVFREGKKHSCRTSKSMLLCRGRGTPRSRSVPVRDSS
eukprot:57536-Amphidinium_carterae.2